MTGVRLGNLKCEVKNCQLHLLLGQSAEVHSTIKHCEIVGLIAPVHHGTGGLQKLDIKLGLKGGRSRIVDGDEIDKLMESCTHTNFTFR
jgi:hypothetical protein